MKLNKDCVREVLIYLEEHLGYNDHLDASTIQIDPYTSEEILYTISLLSEAGYIKAVSVAHQHILWNPSSCQVTICWITSEMTMYGEKQRKLLPNLPLLL